MPRSFFAISLLLAAGLASAVEINEFRPNPPGSDPAVEPLELIGTPNTAFSGVLLSIESDAGTSQGRVDYIRAISGVFDANGLLLTQYDDIENPSFTLVLLDSFSGDTNTDIDLDNDGLVDNIASFGNVLDAIGVSDLGVGGDPVFGAALGGQDIELGTEPELVFRDSITGMLYSVVVELTGTAVLGPDGTAIDTSLFNLDPTQATFGSVNPSAVPLPASIWLVGSGLVLMAGRFRRRQTH